MSMRSLLVLLVLTFPYAADAADIRYYFSEVGLSDPDNIHSPALSPGAALQDPVVNPAAAPDGRTRLYLWFENPTPSTENPAFGTTLNGIEFDIRATGDAVIEDFLFFNYPTGLERRWSLNPNVVEGSEPQSLSRVVAIASTTVGIFNGTLADQFDGHFDRATSSTLFGYLDVSGTSGAIQIEHRLGIMRYAGPRNHRVRLGWDGPFPGSLAFGFSNESPEATIVPEPGTVTLLILSVVAIRRCRRTC